VKWIVVCWSNSNTSICQQNPPKPKNYVALVFFLIYYYFKKKFLLKKKKAVRPCYGSPFRDMKTKVLSLYGLSLKIENWRCYITFNIYIGKF
jgi:hypothetical protein